MRTERLHSVGEKELAELLTGPDPDSGEPYDLWKITYVGEDGVVASCFTTAVGALEIEKQFVAACSMVTTTAEGELLSADMCFAFCGIAMDPIVRPVRHIVRVLSFVAFTVESQPAQKYLSPVAPAPAHLG